MLFPLLLSFLALFLGTLAAPIPLSERQETVSNVKCTSSTALDSHTVNVALLQICGGISGAIEQCEGAPASTTGVSGNVQFSVTPAQAGATINISKGRWERASRIPFIFVSFSSPAPALKIFFFLFLFVSAGCLESPM
ncbi:hypothetical protein DFH11DRAFT_1598164 [Phellopilus nigrolimitatus]|nr:hypothetical protein DFH11DRAFT_1598164 [Phellopilus nigrolimitatus]